MRSCIHIAILAIVFVACPSMKRQPNDQRATIGKSPGPGNTKPSTDQPPILLSADPLQKEIDRLRALGFTGLIRVRSDVDATGHVEKCEVNAALSDAQKTEICNAYRSRRFRTSKAFNVEETFVPPSLR